MNENLVILIVIAVCLSICTAQFCQNDDNKVSATSNTSHRPNKNFPKNFIWGAGTSAYQVEGAWNVSGKGLSIWDYATHNYPEKFLNEATGDVAAKSYFLYKEDVKALKTIGMNHYRFSISWSRILPNGDLSEINELGLQHYDQLINELLANGIEPLVTIFHFDLPQKLQEIGGMLNPVIVEHFVNYAEILFKRYGDRVKLWGTINEPMIFCQYGYGSATIAPFVNSSGVGDYICGHHALLAHAKAYHLYHDYYNQDKAGKIGLIIASNYYYPADPKNPEDVRAAYKTLQFWLGWFAHPIFSKTGGYPKIMENAVRENSRKENLPVSRLPSFTESEKRLVRGTSDCLFLNYYTSNLVTPANANDTAAFPTPSFDRDVNAVLSVDPNWAPSAAPYFYLVPEGLRDILRFIKKEYGNPSVIITENGWADSGGLDDTGRETFLTTHLQSVLDAIWDDGCRVKGHFTWALIDTFEFGLGYTIKFGLYEVDYDSPIKTRTARNSSKLLRRIIKSGKLPK